MRKYILGAAIVGAFFAVFVLASARVTDKSATGIAGNKQYEIQVDYGHIGVGEVWITVPERVWDGCHVGGRFPQCGG